MWTFILLSWRNIWRHRRRSMVVISSIGIGMFGMLSMMAVMNSVGTQMMNNAISTSIGHIAIHKKGFHENGTLDLNFNPDKNIMKSVSGIAQAYSPKIKIQGMVRSSEAAIGVMVIGIDPAMGKTVSRIYEYTSTKDGSKFLDDPAEDSILISKEMANKLDLVIGDKLVLVVQNKKEEIAGERLNVKGIFESPLESVDKIVVYVGIKKLQKMTGLGNNISEITIILKDDNLVDSIKKALITGIGNPGLEILTWKDMVPDLESFVNLTHQMMFIFYIIIFITITFTVANITIMSIMERFHEIGVMKSIGTRPSRIFFMIMFEAFNLCLAGLTLGLTAGIIAVGIFSFIGIDVSAFSEFNRGWGIGDTYYPFLKIRDIITSFIGILLTAVIASLYPARKAAKIKPIDALNFI
jgi:putative ABC transport system permease protein